MTPPLGAGREIGPRGRAGVGRSSGIGGNSGAFAQERPRRGAGVPATRDPGAGTAERGLRACDRARPKGRSLAIAPRRRSATPRPDAAKGGDNGHCLLNTFANWAGAIPETDRPTETYLNMFANPARLCSADRT